MDSRKNPSNQACPLFSSVEATDLLSGEAPADAVHHKMPGGPVILTIGRDAPDKRKAVERAVTAKEDLVLIGDAAAALTNVPDCAVQTVVTSPPYWSIRDYDGDGQIGMNEPLPIYIKSLVSIFDEVRRVLIDDGTVWMNIGDSYTSGNRAWSAPDKKNPALAMSVRPPTPEGLKDKDPIGVPRRLALAMRDVVRLLRSDTYGTSPIGSNGDR